ncbi:MAG TPA: GNAT family N-acetyltransferase [Thermoleophilia bacterium]|nr:GNAT family N-acetyltransferase [Thermoleophilia bacterium]
MSSGSEASAAPGGASRVAPPAAMPAAAYPDLGATVVLGGDVAGLAAELEDLYGSIYATLDYIAAFDRLEPAGAVTLEGPRHVLLFARRGDTLEVLTRRIAIDPRDARRACLALFRALPDARRIHLEVPFPPRELGLPTRTLYSADDMVISLPGSLAEYEAMLGTSTRRNLRSYENRLRRAFPDLATTIEPVGERAEELFALFLDWKRSRMAEKGELVSYDRLPERAPRFVELLRRRGEVHLTVAAGRPIVLVFACPVGRASFLLQNAYDPELAYYHLGMLSQYWLVADAIARGLERVSLLWGTVHYKARLGARPSPGTHVSVFPSQVARLHSLDEAREVAARRLRGWAEPKYWRARHAAGRRLRSLRARVGRSR